jgi:4-hydroxybenzoate polyprenyltransferase/phosphoserine phosphatase
VPAEPRPAGSVPLCVDLDHTLIRTDILWESLLQLRKRPIVAARAMLALVLQGKAAFKRIVMAAVAIDPATLPYRDEVLSYVRQQREIGRETVLATASHRIAAQRIADHLGVFSDVLATDGATNLSGAQKRAALERAYGARGFDYIGDSHKDLATLAAARSGMLVNPSRLLLRKAAAAGNVSRVFTEPRARGKELLRALRVHQWAKNVLLVVPLVAAHKVGDLQACAAIAIAFFAYGLVASAAYVINDLVDLQSDRLHAQKRFRPFASGQLSVPSGLGLALALALAGFGAAVALLPAAFVGYLLVYLALTLAYSFDLKRRLFVDVLALAVLYTLRILAGAAAIGVLVSEWLLMFSVFLFISLAFLKRVIELKAKADPSNIAGRGYSLVDLDTMRIIGVSSGLISVLVLALYINSPATSGLYRAPQVLWLICPLLIYWISRIWFLAGRDQVHHDPVVFALVDWRSYVVGAMAIAVIFVAAWGLPSL